MIRLSKLLIGRRCFMSGVVVEAPIRNRRRPRNGQIKLLDKGRRAVGAMCNQSGIEMTTSRYHDTGISVYNSLTKSIVPFTLIRRNTVYWYMCGPTCYDEAHIGHASCYVKFDIVRRIMESFFGLDIVLLLGITDVDDKIIRRASESNVDFSQLAQKYERHFFSDMRALNVISPSMVFRVTDSISEIIAFVRKLVEKGFAYVDDEGSVYFDVTKYGTNRYGMLKPHRIEMMDERSLDVTGWEHRKRNIADFALWKAVNGDCVEPGWPSPWCAKGRPGWHIECSTMASHAFGDRLDVHSGGVDLLFPHHENELAQSCARHSVDQWVNYWMHSGHVLIAGEKMSKSLGNVITIRDFLGHHESDVLRVACLLSHYRKSMNYTESVFDEPRTILRRLRSFVGHAKAYVEGTLTLRCNILDEPLILRRLDECKKETRIALADDFDTHLALDQFMEFVTFANRQLLVQDDQLHAGNDAVTRSPVAVALVVQYVRKFTKSLGISLNEEHEQRIDDQQQQQSDLPEWQNIMDELVRFRKEVREIALDCNRNDGVMGDVKRKLLRASDRAREALLANGFEIQDHRKDSFWIRTKLK